MLHSALLGITLKCVIFISGVVKVTTAIQQCCRSSMSESNERVCQFVLDMIRSVSYTHLTLPTKRIV